MNQNRANLLRKIRALLAKTTENGCSEHEALAALNMAQGLMDAYEVTDTDLELGGEEATTEVNEANDPHGIRGMLAVEISYFCDVKVWRNKRQGSVTFCGLRVDIEFASWLLDSLSFFVKNQLGWYLGLNGSKIEPGRRGLHIKGFVFGCTSKINERLRELTAKRTKSTNKNALMIIKTDLITKKMKELGINLVKSRNRGKHVDNNSFKHGRAAGDHATFGRPVGSGPVLKIGKQ